VSRPRPQATNDFAWLARGTLAALASRMASARLVTFALAFSLLLALPGCTGSDGLAPDAHVHVTDAGGLDVVGDPPIPVACPDPAPGCTVVDCITDPNDPRYGSCGGELVECDPNNGQWHHIGYCEPFPLRVAGTWDFTQAPQGADPCPELTRVDHHVLEAHGGGISYELSAPDGTSLGLAQVDEGFHPGSDARFALDDAWSATDGSAVSAHVDYELHFGWDNRIGGSAHATVARPGGACDYSFTVAGTRTPE